MLLNVLLGDEASAALPSHRRVVENVEDLEPAWMSPGERVKFLAEEDVFLVDVGIDERDRGSVCWVAENGTDNLNHGCDASTSSNHAEVRDEAGGILEVTLGTLDAELVTGLEGGDIAGDVTLLVRLG